MLFEEIFQGCETGHGYLKGYKPNGSKDGSWAHHKINYEEHFKVSPKGLSPVNERKRSCRYICGDVDEEIDPKKFCAELWKIDAELFAFKSLGNRWHVYKFFDDWIDAYEARKLAEDLEKKLMKLSNEVDTGHTLPHYFSLEKNKPGYWMYLPYHKDNCKCYNPRGNPLTKEQFEFRHTWRKHPLIAGSVGMVEEGEGKGKLSRHKALFNIALYLHHNKINLTIEEVNNHLANPIPDTETYFRHLANQVEKPDYDEEHLENNFNNYIKDVTGVDTELELNTEPDGTQEKTEKETIKNISKSLCYVMANDMFNKLGSADFYQSRQLNNYHKHQVKKGTLSDLLLKDPDFDRAETFITSAKYKPGLINITKPGIIPLINKGIVLNIYIPNYLTEKKGDVKFLIEFFIWLVGLEKWKIIEQWIAYMLQYPGEKIKWSIVLVSAIEGAGKGLLARILSRILGIDNVNENANYKHLTNVHNTLLIGTQVLVLNEVSLGDFKSKTEGTNTLKNFVADDYYTCNFKGKPMVKLPNLTNFMLFSNDERVLGVSQGVRRYFFCNITKTEEEIVKKTNEGFFQKAWDFADSDEGASALIYYFNKEVKISDPAMFKRRAPETEDLKQLIDQSKHPVQKKLEHDLTRPDIRKRKIFVEGWCGLITFDELNERMNTTNKDDDERFNWGSWGDDALFKFLSANSARWNNGDTTRQISINGVKHRFYLLDDTKCPVPNKSYKDLTPKQIETIYLNYYRAEKDIKEEEKNYTEAKEILPGLKKEFMEKIKFWISLKNKKSPPLGLEPEKAYEGIMNGTIPLEHNDTFTRNNIQNKEAILKRGIRTPVQILEDLRTETSAKDLNNLNGEKPSLPEGKSTLHPPKPSLDL